MKAVLALSLALLCLLPTHARAAQVDITAPSAILMEKSTGEVLFEQDSHAVYEPASVTKIMTLLLVMEKLRDVDEVSYVRFASVYRQFKDINTFMDELNKLLKER